MSYELLRVRNDPGIGVFINGGLCEHRKGVFEKPILTPKLATNRIGPSYLQPLGRKHLPLEVGWSRAHGQLIARRRMELEWWLGAATNM